MTTLEYFKKDIAKHELTVIMENGLYRHLRFKRPGTMCMHFDILTWPGYLCYTGDMGTYVFRRLEDMLQFFRITKTEIDFPYWAEKLQAVDCNSGKGNATEFSPARFKQVIREYLHRWIRKGHQDGSLDKDERRELWQAVHDEVLSYYGNDQHDHYARANDFRWSINPRSRAHVYRFDDLWDHRMNEYTHHFKWCCYALQWAVSVYDAHKDQK